MFISLLTSLILLVHLILAFIIHVVSFPFQTNQDYLKMNEHEISLENNL